MGSNEDGLNHKSSSFSYNVANFDHRNYCHVLSAPSSLRPFALPVELALARVVVACSV